MQNADDFDIVIENAVKNEIFLELFNKPQTDSPKFGIGKLTLSSDKRHFTQTLERIENRLIEPQSLLTLCLAKKPQWASMSISARGSKNKASFIGQFIFLRVFGEAFAVFV